MALAELICETYMSFIISSKFGNNRKRANQVAKGIETDVNGQITPTGVTGEKYLILSFIDNTY